VPPGVHWREHWPDLVNHLKPVATTTA